MQHRTAKDGLTFRNVVLVAFLVISLVAAGAATAQPGQTRNFDARANFNAGFQASPGQAQRQAVDQLRSSLPSLSARFSSATGATRSLNNQVGYLTGRQLGADAAAIADGFVRGNAGLLGLGAADLSGMELVDRVPSAVTGATHLYYRQTHRGLPVYNGLLQVGVNREGRVLGVSNAFLPAIGRAAGNPRARLSAADAAGRAADHLGLDGGGAGDAVNAQQMWLPVRQGNARLVWNFQLPTRDGAHYYDFTVDAVSGKIWTRFDWVADANYRVYEQPVESPNHTSPLPPSDARTLQVDPADAVASPFGWHDTNGAAGAEFTITRGNNAHAYEDTDANNTPPATDVDCGGSLSCDFPIALGSAPSAYIPASITNLFYWNNVIHDIQYQYGFDEAGGNFQVNNYGNGGVGGDDVRAEGQDGAGNCNANFLTLPDGTRPRMQMFTCTNTSPAADGDLDNGVIVHEFGHGISNRQVGGPSNVSCLDNRQQPGEGWSDWLAMAYTAETGDAGTDARGMGTYLFGQPPNGPGIRPAPYSTDFGVNNFTYSDIQGLSIPHGVGFVWATAAWEAYWELVDFHGFSTDLYNAGGSAGNQRMMLYVNEGLKNTACGPTFLDARDGIIQAATDNHAGEDVCRLWTAFARRGLGSDASTPGPNAVKGTDGFSVPASCTGATCGDESCDPGEDQCSCPLDCGTPPANEVPNLTCTDEIDNDCDLDVDCDDSDCFNIDPACICIADGLACNKDGDCCSGNCSNGPPASRVCLP